MSCYSEVDTNYETEKFNSMCGTIKCTLKSNTRIDTRLQFRNTVAMLGCLYGNELCTEKKIHAQALRSAICCTKICNVKQKMLSEDELQKDWLARKILRYRKKGWKMKKEMGKSD